MNPRIPKKSTFNEFEKFPKPRSFPLEFSEWIILVIHPVLTVFGVIHENFTISLDNWAFIIKRNNMTGWVVLWEYVILWLLNLYLKGSIKYTITHRQWSHNYNRAQFYNKFPTWIPGTHASQDSSALTLWLACAQERRHCCFTMNFIETIKVTEEKFAPLKRKDLLLPEGRKCGLFALPRSGYVLPCLVTEITHLVVTERCMHGDWIFSQYQKMLLKGFIWVVKTI